MRKALFSFLRERASRLCLREQGKEKAADAVPAGWQGMQDSNIRKGVFVRGAAGTTVGTPAKFGRKFDREMTGENSGTLSGPAGCRNVREGVCFFGKIRRMKMKSDFRYFRG